MSRFPPFRRSFVNLLEMENDGRKIREDAD
jgi:hypothetical protein